MAKIEYPKHVYKGEGDERTSIVVKNAGEEAEAITRGYEALPSAPDLPEAEAAAIEAQGAYLEYPKHVYRGEGDARESRVVKSADEEADAVADGYAPVGSPIYGQIHGASADQTEPDPEKPAKASKKAPKSKA